jgi:O-acetyl-ADP-ribose deacetylase (regulator of RNase III)
MAPLNVSSIPTVRLLYRSRRLLQRDQSYAPNDTYNQVISFCYHDLTQLRVDAIVNSANKAMRDTGGKTLNNIIHQAAGPELGKEAKAKGKIKDQAVLTGGYNLAAKHIIHVLRPGYYNSKGMTEFNQLIDCYRKALKIAADNQLKTVAFPCLGTGGVGFPARVAARITLQEVREYLDMHQDYNFERIIFCVHTAADEKAYLDFLPVYFPPTHDDIETARTSIWSEDRTAVAAQVLDTRNAVQKVFSELHTGLSLSVPNFPADVLGHLDVTDSALASIRRSLLWSNELNKSMRDLKLVCTVLQLFSGNITEIIDLAKDHASLGQRSDKSIWDDYVSDMNNRHATEPSTFLRICRDFTEGLDSMITRNGVDLDEVIEMVDMRKQLERYKVRQKGGGEAGGAQDHLDEVLYVREFQRETVVTSRDTVKLYQIQSVSQLYKLGELEETATLAHPSTLFNDNICLVREDITKLEVDIMVNSTDTTFGGMGTLDRSVFRKGGVELRNAVESFGNCKEGDVRLTEGYLLPAKHVLHTVPPEQYRKDTKDMLRKIYREVLHTAVAMRATSIALPSIGKCSHLYIDLCITDWSKGTGMLNYPRRDCVSLALEETKRFLESAVPDSKLQKIIFVVYSSNDEFVYKRLLPVYFPPIDLNLNRVSHASVARQDTGASTHSSLPGAPRRTLFGSISEAFRSVRSGKTVETSRSINANEEHALISFESHAKDCETCKDIDRLYTEGRDLCEYGYSAAQVVLWHMNMHSDLSVYTKPDAVGQSVGLEIPMDMFPIANSLLATVEKSCRDGDRSRPFVTPNRPYGAIIRDQGLEIVPPGGAPNNTDVEGPVEPQPKKARAHVLTRSAPAEQYIAVAPNECQIRVYPNRVDVLENSNQMHLVSLKLDRSTVVQRYMTTPEVELTGASRLQSTLQIDGQVLFRCRSDDECNSLLRMVRRAIEGLQSTDSTEIQHERLVPPAEAEQGSSDDYLQWNKRLHDVRDELASIKRAGGGLSDLQYKMERLSAATSDLHETQQASGSSKLFDPSRSPLATRVLVCLTADLKSRPGSYVGMKTDHIVSELHTTTGEVLSALMELMAEGEVHHTVDEDTWVVTHPPNNLPVLSQEQAETNIRDTGILAEQYAQPIQDPRVDDPPVSTETQRDPDIGETKASSPLETAKQMIPREGVPPLDITTAKVYTYLLNYTYAPPDGAHHILDIAAAVYLTREEVRKALAELKELGLAHVTGKDGWWWATKVAQEDKGKGKEQAQDTETSTTTIRDIPSFKGTPGGDREKEREQSGDFRKRYRGDREGRGQQKGKEAKDEAQEKLDRVIAGDMKEEEMRHFGDMDDERYI